MSLLVISSIPVFILLIFRKQLPKDIRLILQVFCIPFIILIAFYSLIIGIVLIAGCVIYKKFIKNTRPTPKPAASDSHVYEGEVVSKHNKLEG